MYYYMCDVLLLLLMYFEALSIFTDVCCNNGAAPYSFRNADRLASLRIAYIVSNNPAMTDSYP